MKELIALLPEVYASQLRHADFQALEEIRISAGAPVMLKQGGCEIMLGPRAAPSHLQDILHAACNQSIYAYTDTLAQGFVTIEHGHRIGVCGTGVVRNGSVTTLRAPTSLLIRVAHAIPGCAADLLPHVSDSTLILGPPGSGKTTLLRDLIRLLSETAGQRVGLIDERGELSACRDGFPQLEVGCRTDILVNIPKATALMMLLRTMSPKWIAVDEITSPEDIQAMEQASFCGIRLLATAHGSSLQDLFRRPLYRRLMRTRIFQKVIAMDNDKSYQILEVPE